jgi:hypothetical protein
MGVTQYAGHYREQGIQNVDRAEVGTPIYIPETDL